MKVVRTVIVTTLGFVVLAVLVAAALAQSSSSADPGEPVKLSFTGDLRYSEAAAFRQYGLFAPGSNFNGIPLVAITRRNDPPNPLLPPDFRPRRANWVNFIYASDCFSSEGGVSCKNEAQVQVWPACERNPSVYARGREVGDVSVEMATVRGVPAALFEDETMLEIYSGDSTIVLFASNQSELLDLADSLSSVNSRTLGRVDTSRAQPLPSPKAGVMTGSVSCAGTE